jgi:hypothetical protein
MRLFRTSLADYKEETWMTNVPLYAIQNLANSDRFFNEKTMDFT